MKVIRYPLSNMPRGTRLILASDDLLAQWGARTVDGYRITAEWGEQRPEGWYEPTFTVHYDQPDAIQAECRCIPVSPGGDCGCPCHRTETPTGDLAIVREGM